MKPLCVDIHTHHPTAAVTLRTAGIHPWQAAECRAADAASLRLLLGDVLASAQAIGETGIDMACGVDIEAQERLFSAHVQLASVSGMPVVIHCVRAFEPVMKILAGSQVRVVFHGFIGSEEQALRAVGRGYFLSFGMRSFRSPRTVAAMRSVPAGNLFLETDDDPTPIEEVYATACALLGTDVGRLAEITLNNYNRLLANG